MKLTKEILKQLIKEELESTLEPSVFSKPSRQILQMDFATMIAETMPVVHFIQLGDAGFIFMKDSKGNIEYTGNVQAGRGELEGLGYDEMKSEDIQRAYEEQRAIADKN